MKSNLGLAVTGLLIACLHPVFGQPAGFTFSGGNFPEACVLQSNRNLVPVNQLAAITFDSQSQPPDGICLTGDASRGGVYLKSDNPEADSLFQAMKAFTVSLRIRFDTVSNSPIFFERMLGSTNKNPGYFRFGNQSNTGDAKERRGTLRFLVTDPSGNYQQVASSESWIQIQEQWATVGLTFDQGAVQFYVNGEPLGEPQKITVEQIPSGAPDLTRHIRAAFGFEGAFDDLLVVPDQALSPEQMQAVYQNGIQGSAIEELTK